ncbi:MAG: hypothetical protein KBS65_06060 [Prevotella sp.]|nr:hypothetical protein [Candidatus Equicola stercoris]
MKKFLILILLIFCVTVGIDAATTTYVFTSATWKSKVGTVVTDAKTDGWVCNKEATDYNEGRTDAKGALYSRGVGVKTGTTGAGCTSVITFNKVRKVIVNFCQNASKGKGSINISVGGNTKSITVTKPEVSGEGVYNRDAELVFGEESGQVTMSVDCTENGIYINTITIKADNGSPNNPSVTGRVFKLVTDATQLKDGDEVFFGVAKPDVNYVMGIWDESFSKNNIAAVKARYDEDRQVVTAGEEYSYMVERHGDSIAFLDIYNWYLVASGGNPNRGANNYLTVWDKYRSENYGNYGLWNVQISADGKAVVKSYGKSRSNLIQFNPNASNSKPIFACYAEAQYTPVAIYRRQDSVDITKPLIQCNFVNFGTRVLTEGKMEDSKKLTVQALNLKEDITASLKDGTVFKLDKTMLDRDGDDVTITYEVDATGDYMDSLILRSGETVMTVAVLLHVDKTVSIADARKMHDLTMCWLNDVTVTKKYDMHIFAKDETGAILLYDAGNMYGQGIKKGDVLTGVTGYTKNYYGNPEVCLSGQFEVTGQSDVVPEIVEKFDSTDVCRFVRMEDINISTIRLYDLFKYMGGQTYPDNVNYNVEGIVYYYDEPVLCPTLIEVATGVTPVIDNGQLTIDNSVYNLQGQRLNDADTNYRGIIIRGGKKYLMK